MTRWADDPTGRLRSVKDQVAGMESALIRGNLRSGTAFANALVADTTELLDELDLDPNRDPELDAELISTLRVYRNAAFVFRKLAGVDGEPDPAMGTLCAAMIDQGHDHLRALRGQTPEQDQSTE
jgi:hypothetical protein